MSKQLLFNEGCGLNGGTTLWENPNPNAQFGNQNVTLSQSYKNFSYVGVVYKWVYSTDASNMFEVIFRRDDLEKTKTGVSERYSIGLGVFVAVSGARNGYVIDDTTFSFTRSYTQNGDIGSSGAVPVKIIGY